MKIISEGEGAWFLRFDKGDDVVANMLVFAKEKGIAAGHFTVIGACGELTLSYYCLPDKKYEDHEFNEDLEIVSVTGNIGRLNGEPALHAHGVFGKRDLSTVGGHIKKLIISATGEVYITRVEGEIMRAFDEPTGLNLIQ